MSQLLVLLLIIISLSCQENPKRGFRELRLGMGKDAVIDILGTPNKSFRWQGRDRWIYRIFEDNKQIEKEVHFVEGKVIYAGKPLKTSSTAVEDDLKIDAQNKEVNKVIIMRGGVAPPPGSANIKTTITNPPPPQTPPPMEPEK